MVDEKLNSIEQIEQHIQAKNNFVLNGGAGSGKTSALMDVLDLLCKKNPKHKIACITFTNVAANEITGRMSNKNINLKASTIHDFLWDIIKNYQKNLKQVLLELINSNDISYSGEEKLTDNWFKDRTIDYREWRKIEEGIISHNEVLQLANKLFKDFPLLRKILKDKYDFILIDEYQDTEKQVIEIFLNYLQKENDSLITGLFGDSMQSIYDKGIEDLQEYIDDGTVKEVPKEDNWRCAKSVITLINKVRNDGLQQEPAGENLEGKITFLYSNKDQVNIEEIKQREVFNDFDFSNYQENKELYLTHKLIARQFGFENLLSNYEYKENLTSDNPDRLAKHLFKIQGIILLYKNKKYNEFIKKTDYKILKNSDLQTLKDNIDKLEDCSEKTIEETINFADKLGIVEKDDKLQNFISEHEEQYNKVKDLSYSEVINLFEYRDEHSPYSTQHGVKGAEFENVFVILNNGRWNQYNFSYLFENRNDKESIVNRTRKIFYVCCSRAKKNLVVFYHNPSEQVLSQAKEWFGEKNVVEI
ncbi:MAG: ATP-dependent helicase [Candidatus Pacebacteria bacterium]|nr:ATP-dependent helicase [Candidatus Paceibacterota bacterium]